MTNLSRIARAIALVAATAPACATAGHAQPLPPPPSEASLARAAIAPPPPPAPPERRVYRLDFVLRSEEPGGAPTSTSFTLTLEERERGEVVVGKNVALATTTTTAAAGATTPPPSARLDVGLKVVATLHALGDDVLLEVSTELSAYEAPSTVRKVVSKGNALAAPGKPALVTTLDVDRGRHELSVTATRLR
jgi:hypothetical protein